MNIITEKENLLKLVVTQLKNKVIEPKNKVYLLKYKVIVNV